MSCQDFRLVNCHSVYSSGLSFNFCMCSHARSYVLNHDLLNASFLVGSRYQGNIREQLPLPLHNSHLASDLTLVKTGFLSLLVLRTGFDVDLVLIVVSLERFFFKLLSVFDLVIVNKLLHFVDVMKYQLSTCEVFSIMCFDVRKC